MLCVPVQDMATFKIAVVESSLLSMPCGPVQDMATFKIAVLESSLLSMLCVPMQDMATFKIAALQKALDDSVPASELELVNKQYTELTEKYRDTLESTKSLIAFKEEASGYQVGIYW